MPLKKHDFVEIEYTGKLADGTIFDTTDAKIAKEQGFQGEYKPVIICIGEHHVLKGIDEFLVGKELGAYNIKLAPEQAFGKKDAQLMRMVPRSKFTEHKINPVPGLQVNMDGAVGTVKTVSGGRCVVDFNHPLAGQDVVYDVKVAKIVEDKKVQIESLLKLLLGVRAPKVEIAEKKATITLPAELPKQIADPLAKKIGELTGLEISFVTEEKAVK